MHPALVAVLKRVIAISTQNFTIVAALRSLDHQKKLVASGASKTLNPMSIVAADCLKKSGKQYCHAVGLMPWIDGLARWESASIYSIVVATSTA